MRLGRLFVEAIRSKLSRVPRRTREQRLGSFVGAVAVAIAGFILFGGWGLLLLPVTVGAGAVLGHGAASLMDYVDGA